MRNAARRGVRVKLIVQGEPDIPIVKFGAHLLYHYLVKGGVQIYEYRRRPLHGKVALADDHWATVGSSNLDPLSLSLNLEANLIIHDRVFNQTLRDNLNGLIARDCQRIDKTMLPKRNWWRLGVSVMAFHFLRHFPAWVGWLPAHTPRLARVSPPVQPEIETQDRVESPARIIHYEQITSPLADGEKSADRALFYRRHRPVGDLRAKSRLAGRVEGDPRLRSAGLV